MVESPRDKADAPVTLITGTRKGIGAFLAQRYARLGHRVIGCSRGEIDWTAPGYEHHRVDVTDERAVQNLFSVIRTEHGRLDHLINNAGVAAMNHALLTPMSSVDNVLSTNVGGVFLCCREAAKLMMTHRSGRIVNLASVAAPLRIEGEAVYAASKAAVVTITEILAREFAEFGITVNAIGPTPIDTDLIRAVPEQTIARLVRRQAVKRMGTREDVANVIDFFLRAESDFITGQCLYLGGV
jgi:3-oxoacyl-[acyl-carrier protein] reductase